MIQQHGSTVSWLDQAHQQFEQCRFACSIRPQQRTDTPGSDGQIHIANDPRLSEITTKAIRDNRRLGIYRQANV
jgi:hypothetical protein